MTCSYFVYHCFDRIVILGHLPLPTRPENIVHFSRDGHGIGAITKDVLRQRTDEYHHRVDAFARNHYIPIEWAENGVRKEDYVRPRCSRWSGATASASVSPSRAWRLTPTSVRRHPNIPSAMQTNASSAASARGILTIISTFATRCSGQLRYALVRSCSSQAPTILTRQRVQQPGISGVGGE